MSRRRASHGCTSTSTPPIAIRTPSERLGKLGARPADIGQTGQEQSHLLADREGNEFCLLKARLSPL
jgi:hypothetical protein